MSPRLPSNRLVTLFVLVLVVASGGGAVPALASEAASITVTNATHSPATPTVGEPFEVTATIQNQPSADGPFELNEVVVEVPGRGPAGFTRTRNLGTLSPGSTIEVGLPATVVEPGWHTLRVHVYGRSAAGRAVTVSYPVTVQVVERQRPQLDVDAGDGVVGVESGVEVTVANGLADTVRNLRVELRGEAVQIDRQTRVRSALATETETNYTFDVTPTRAGNQRLTATLTYTDGTGETQTVTEQFGFSVDELDSDVRLDVAAVRSETPAVDVTVVNVGNAPIEDVTVTGESGSAALSTALVDRVESRASETVRLNVTDLAAVGDELTVTADYEVGGERRTVNRTASGVFVPGRVELTGIVAEQTDDGVVRITGTASNVGTTRVQAVTVEVATGTGSNPGAEYFVGAIDASDFASFTVNARVDGETETTIPLEVTYLVDGEERTRTVQATYDPPETPEQRGSVFPLVGGGVVLAVAVAAVFLWRRRRAD